MKAYGCAAYWRLRIVDSACVGIGQSFVVCFFLLAFALWLQCVCAKKMGSVAPCVFFASDAFLVRALLWLWLVRYLRARFVALMHAVL